MKKIILIVSIVVLVILVGQIVIGVLEKFAFMDSISKKQPEKIKNR
jgi:hypothetical protein